MKLPGIWHESRPYAYASEDGRTVVEIKSRAQGIRDLHAALMQLAVWIGASPNVDRALLAVHLPRITLPRVRKAWSDARAALRPAIARKLALAVLGPDQTWVDPPEPELVSIAQAIASQIDFGGEGRVGPTASSPSLFEIGKVLVDAWLRRRGPLQVKEIERRVGCSYPTVAAALDELERRRELTRASDRRVALRALPRQTFEEMTVRSDSLRRTTWLVDVSGRRPDPEALLRRLQRAHPSRLALGGVLAARHYHAAFDLHGTPRIDLTSWLARGAVDDDARLTKLDPGLKVSTTRQAEAIGAVHRIVRAESSFEESPGSLPYADPVETLLDLHELHLTAQADALVRHMRGGAT